MHRVHLHYRFDRAARNDDTLVHPLFAVLRAIHEVGSIAGAARRLQLSYRHVWGELKRWESELGHPLVHWAKGQPAGLTAFGERLMWAEARAQARLAPQIDALRTELERAIATALDDSAPVLAVAAGHDDAMRALRELAARSLNVHVDVQHAGSLDALVALDAGRCVAAAFHALTDADAASPTAAAFRPLIDPRRHRLLAVARRTQGLVVPAGNPRGLSSLADVATQRVGLANRRPGSGTRVLIDELLARAGIDAALIAGHAGGEPSHEAAAAAVASGSADVAIGIEPPARRRGLGFVPLVEERCFLVATEPSLREPSLVALRGLLAGAEWRALLATLPGHAAADAGEVLSPTDVLPWWNEDGPNDEPEQKGPIR